MRLCAAKWFTMAVLSTAAFGIASTSNEVEACCGLWNCLFGWCGGGCGGGGCGPSGGYVSRGYYGPAMGRCGPSGCNSGTYYGPIGWRGWSQPWVSDCSSCGSVACAPCSSGDCAVSGSGVAPALNDKWQKKETFAPTDAADAFGTGTGTGTGPGEPGRLPRTGTESGINGERDKSGRLQNESGDGFKPAKQVDENGNDTSSTGGKRDLKATGPSKGPRRGPTAPRIEDDEPNAGKRPTISIDDKVAWRSAPARTRIVTRPHVVSARLARLPAYPKSEWLPVESESKVARK